MSKPSTPALLKSAGCVAAALVVAAAAMIAFGTGARGTIAKTATRPAPTTTASSAVSDQQRSRVRAAMGALPLAFEANQGQSDPQVKYMARGNGYKLFLTSSQAIMKLPARKRTSEVQDMMLNKRRGASAVRAMLKKRMQSSGRESSVAVLKMNLFGANPHVQLAAKDMQEAKANYFLGKDPTRWQTNVPMYGRVNYQNVYRGVDLAFHGAARQLEFDYLVKPGADPSPISLSFEGAQKIVTNEVGDLILTTSAGPVELHKPFAYQLRDDAREPVEAHFVLAGAHRVAFELGKYDHSRELVIDPTVTYSAYYGGDFADYGISIAVDASGNSYVVGATDSDAIPGFNSPTIGGFDTFVTKFDSGGALKLVTEFGGSGDDFPGGIAVDSQGVYVSGTTDSSDFPATVGQTTFLGGVSDGNNDAYAVKLDLTLNLLNGWATYIAGSDSDSGLAVAVDSNHNVYVVGETFSNDLGGATGGVSPLPNGSSVNLGSSSGDDDGYIVKLNSGGTAYDLVSYIGGSSGDLATGVALDGSGNIYVSGETISADLPVTSGVVQGQCGTDGTCNAGSSGAQDDAFVVSIKANLSNYNYVTYYGGSGVDDAFAIAADTSGKAFFTGTTSSSNFPTGGTPFQSSLGGTTNAFLVELNSSGSTATYGSYLGGNGSDFGVAVALDTSDNVYLTGQTSSSNFPTVNPTQATLSGSTDAFVSVYGPSQNQMLFSTYLGGGGDEDQFAGGVGHDSAGNIYVTGDTDSGNGSTAVFPTTSGASDTTYGGGTCLSGSVSVPCTDAFITVYTSATVPDFTVAATAPSAVTPGSSATSTVTVTALNGYSQAVTLSCSVSGGGSPAPACSASSFSPDQVTPPNTSTLTITTTGSSAALARKSNIFYAMWLPIVGLSLVGMRLSSKDSRKKKLLGFLLLGIVMAMLFILPACGGSSNNSGGGGGGCSGCTPAGSYTVTITGTDSNNLSHATAVTLSVN